MKQIRPIVAGAALALCAAQSTLAAERSVARDWNDMMLASIRRDLGRPTVHARNLFHFSVAMWDAWAAYDAGAQGFVVHERDSWPDVEAARRQAVSYAAYRILLNRFAASPGWATMLPQYRALMVQLGYDPDYTGTTGSTPADVGNRIGAAVVAFGMADGSNQANGYANQVYQPINPPLIVTLPGNPNCVDVRRYQPLALSFFVDQNGFPIPGGYPPFLSAEWGNVTPFAMTAADRHTYVRNGVNWHVWNDPGAPPEINGDRDGLWRRGHEMVAVWSGHLDPADGVVWDTSPGAMGNVNAPTTGDYEPYYRYMDGGDVGTGHAVNPVTGQPYAPQFVKRGDYARVLAEFWADGPSSETPPGHWFAILNKVMDDPASTRRIGGTGPELGALEYEVKAYLALGGAMHDTAVSIWSTKGWYDCARPITAIRWMCQNGQSSDPALPSYSPNGIRLVPGAIELVTAATTAPGERHEALAGYEGQVAMRAWRGPDWIANPAVDEAGVGWILGVQWWPYQRPTFVTPPFGGYVSGHSGYSRAAARVMHLLTGSAFFPGGIGRFAVTQNQYLVFEEGPSQSFEIQSATYYDASNQSSLSRIWGGIHPPFDDIPARGVGDRTGPAAFAHAQAMWSALPCPADLDGSRTVDGNDLAQLLAQWGMPGSADLDASGSVDGADLSILLAAWGPCP